MRNFGFGAASRIEAWSRQFHILIAVLGAAAGARGRLQCLIVWLIECENLIIILCFVAHQQRSSLGTLAAPLAFVVGCGRHGRRSRQRCLSTGACRALLCTLGTSASAYAHHMRLDLGLLAKPQRELERRLVDHLQFDLLIGQIAHGLGLLRCLLHQTFRC